MEAGVEAGVEAGMEAGVEGVCVLWKCAVVEACCGGGRGSVLWKVVWRYHGAPNRHPTECAVRTVVHSQSCIHSRASKWRCHLFPRAYCFLIWQVAPGAR